MASFLSDILSKASNDARGGLRDLRELLAARWALGRLEVDVALAQLRRLAIVLTISAVLALTALPVLIVALANSFRHPALILWSVGGVLLALGILAGVVAWRRFRRDFSPLEDSLAELHEDVTWLREWTGDEKAD